MVLFLAWRRTASRRGRGISRGLRGETHDAVNDLLSSSRGRKAMPLEKPGLPSLQALPHEEVALAVPPHSPDSDKQEDPS